MVMWNWLGGCGLWLGWFALVWRRCVGSCVQFAVLVQDVAEAAEGGGCVGCGWGVSSL